MAAPGEQLRVKTTDAWVRSTLLVGAVLAGMGLMSRPGLARATTSVELDQWGPPELPDQPHDSANATDLSDPLTPQEREERIKRAETYYREGLQHDAQGDYQAAAQAYERSFEAIPAGNTLYNIATAYEKAQLPLEAIFAAQRYLDLPRCEDVDRNILMCSQASQSAKIQASITGQRQLVGQLQINIGDGVRVQQIIVDNKPVPLDAFPTMMLPGTVEIEVVGPKPGQTIKQVAEIRAGERFSLLVPPWPTPQTSGTNGTDAGKSDNGAQNGDNNDGSNDTLTPSSNFRALKGVFWGGLGLTMGSAAALAVLGGLTQYHFDQYQREFCGSPVCEFEMGEETPGFPSDHRSKVEQFRPATNALVVVTAALGVATTVVGVVTLARIRTQRRSGARRRGSGRVAPSGRNRASSPRQALRGPRVWIEGVGLVVRW